MPTIRTSIRPYPEAEQMGRSEQGFTVSSDLLGMRKRTRIAGTINGHAFATGTNPLGDGDHFVFINAGMRRQMGVAVGDAIEVVFELEAQRPEVTLPEDLAAALDAADARAAFDAMAWSHRKRYVDWLDEAKKAETRAARIAKAVPMIAAGTSPF